MNGRFDRKIKTRNGVMVLITFVLIMTAGILFTNVDLIFGVDTSDTNTLDGMDWGGTECSQTNSECNIKAYIDLRNTPCLDNDGGQCYLSQASKSALDADLAVDNIKSGVNIFGVAGSYSGPVYTGCTADNAGTCYLSQVSKSALDADLATGNIKSGVNIFGIAGSSNVVDTTAGTLTANSQLLSGYIGFSDGTQYTGSLANCSSQGSQSCYAAGSYYSATTCAGAAGQQTCYAGASGEWHDNECADFTGALATECYVDDTGKYVDSDSCSAASNNGYCYINTSTITGIDADLTAGNIKSGVNIFSVVGTLEAGGTPVYVWQPVVSGTLYTDNGWNHSMGFKFTPSVNGTITKLGGFFNGTKTVRLYNSSYSSLASASVTAANTWTYTTITAVNVTAGSAYYVVVELASSGGAYRNSPTLPVTSGNVTINLGVLQSPSGTFDASHSETTSQMYGMADVEFTPSGGSSANCTGVPADTDPNNFCSPITCANYIYGWSGSSCMVYGSSSHNGMCNGSGGCYTSVADSCSGAAGQSGSAYCGSSGCNSYCPNGGTATSYDTVAEVCYTDSTQHSCTTSYVCNGSGTCTATGSSWINGCGCTGSVISEYLNAGYSLAQCLSYCQSYGSPCCQVNQPGGVGHCYARNGTPTSCGWVDVWAKTMP